MKGLDWSNESYARLFRRDTPSWELLGMAGQAVYMALLRKLDRAGVLPLDGEAPQDAVAAVLHWDLDFVQAGLEGLLSRGWIVHDAEHDCLLDPEHLDREEVAKSDALRQRESRERRRDRTVTIRDGVDTIRDKMSRPVTRGHDASQPVTPTRALPSPSSASPSEKLVHSTNGRPADEEIEWRVKRVWETHLKARRQFFHRELGKEPGRQPTADPKDILRPIRDGLLRYDKDLLGNRQREEWEQDSQVKAAGVGIFYDPWCSGKDPKNDVNQGGRRYLEPWRPWKSQVGKGSPIPRFAELYFEQRLAREGE